MPTEEVKPCALCGGEGVIVKDDLTDFPCICAKRRLIERILGPEIAHARPLTETPLYVLGDTKGKPQEDRTKKNLFIKTDWPTLISHFRYAFTAKLNCTGFSFRFLTVTDERIKNVFVGNESAKNRAREEIGDTVNALGDLVGEHDLVVIRLGFLGYKNIAMPGALKEALMIREVANKPTWIIEEPESPFIIGHRAYSEEVAAYIDSHFEVLDLRADTSTPTKELRGFDLPNPQTVKQVQEFVQSQVHFEQARPEVDDENVSTAQNLLGLDVGGVAGEEKPWNRKPRNGKGKKRPSGGGPV